MKETCPKCNTVMIPNYEEDCSEEGLDYYLWHDCPKCDYGKCILMG